MKKADITCIYYVYSCELMIYCRRTNAGLEHKKVKRQVKIKSPEVQMPSTYIFLATNP